MRMRRLNLSFLMSTQYYRTWRRTLWVWSTFLLVEFEFHVRHSDKHCMNKFDEHVKHYLPLWHVLVSTISVLLPLPALFSHQPGSFALSFGSHPRDGLLLDSWQMLHVCRPVSSFTVHVGDLYLRLQPHRDIRNHPFDLPPSPQLPSRVVLS